MKDTWPAVTSLVRRAADILFVQNPRGTSVGVFTGVLADGVFRLLGPTLARYKDTIDPSRIGSYYFIAFGIVLFNLPTLTRRRALPKEVEDAFEAIRRTKGEMTQVQLRLQYLALCTEVISRVKMKTPAKARRASQTPA